MILLEPISSQEDRSEVPVLPCRTKRHWGRDLRVEAIDKIRHERDNRDSGLKLFNLSEHGIKSGNDPAQRILRPCEFIDAKATSFYERLDCVDCCKADRDVPSFGSSTSSSMFVRHS